MQSSVKKKTWVITDPGVDDAVGLFVLGALNQDLSFIASYGNAPTQQTSANLAGITDFIQHSMKPEYKKTIDVFTGVDRALEAKDPYTPEGGDLFFIHGKNALEGQFSSHAPAHQSSTQLYEKEATNNEKIDIISLAALTEVALLLQRKELVEKVRSLTFMGGTFFTQGNVDTHSEANLSHDPKALDLILHITHEKQIPLTIVPLDVTEHPSLELTDERRERIIVDLRANGSEKMAEMIQSLVGPGTTYPAFYRQKRGVLSHIAPITKRLFTGCPIHDLTTFFVIEHPELFEIVKIPVMQRYPGILGAPTAWMNPPKTKAFVAMHMNDEKAYWDLVTKYLRRYT